MFRKPFVFTVHDYQPHSGEVHSSYTQNFNNWITRNKHQVIIHNRHDYQLILDSLPEKAHKLNYVPFGKLDIYKSYYRGRLTKTGNILFFGRISPYKGVEYLLEAAKFVHRQLPWLKITIAGKSNYQLSVNGAADEVELIDRYIPNDELASLVTHSDVVVCPYTDATQSAVIMTAFAFGKPVIGTRVGGIPEMIRHQETGILIEPKNAEELAQAILSLYNDETRLPAMRRNIATDQTYSWDRIAGETLEVYKKAINR
jgi:glycosyltransferase involved in cell wall biosynthesis